MDWIGWVLGVVGIIAAVPIGIWIGRRNRQKPDLRVVHDFARVVRPADWLMTGGLTVSYDGKPIEQVSRTFIALWNHRGDTVRGTDEVALDPLRIEVADDDAILQVRVVALSRPQIDVGFVGMVDGEEDVSRRISFDFMDEGDGFVVEVLHKGERPALLLGTLKGSTLKHRYARLDRASRALLRMKWGKRFLFPTLNRFNTAMVAVLLVLVATFAIVYSMTVMDGTPEVVSTRDYDLTTVEGQSEFATEVRREGLDAMPWFPLLLASPIVLVVPMLLLLVIPTRALVPRSVFAVDLDPASEDDMKAARWSSIRSRDRS